jgi:hypothetical protein
MAATNWEARMFLMGLGALLVFGGVLYTRHDLEGIP